MATTVTLEAEIVETVCSLTRERIKASAVRKALNEYIRAHKLRELTSMAGTVRLKFTNKEIEEMER